MSGPDPGWRAVGGPLGLEWVADGWRLRLVQPFQARKRYRCPGCDQPILPGTSHLVAWPEGRPEDRRHWHRPCFDRWLAGRGDPRRR